MIINKNLSIKYNKSYATEKNAIQNVEKILGKSEFEYDIIITQKDERFIPIIKWKREFEYKIMDSVHAQFYTIN